MRKAKPKLPRDPTQIARFAVEAALSEVRDSPAAPVSGIFGYRPTWSQRGRNNRIQAAQDDIAKQVRVKLRQAGPTLVKVIALWRGSKFAGERRAAWAQGERLAARVGLSFDQALAATERGATRK